MPTYIRVKDLANAATTPATDDFILLSGTANGARKISRADFLTAVAGFYTADPSTYKLATLDAGDKVLVSQLPSSAFSYKGTWAASTNTPTLANGTGTAGDTYYASDSGSVNFGAGSISFLAGDAVVYDGSVWQKVPDVVNLLDGKGTLDEAKTTLEIPDVGTAPNEVPLNGQLGTMAFQDSAGVSVEQLEVTDKVKGPLGIDGSPGSYAYSGADDLVVGDASGSRGITISTGSSDTGALYFGDAATTGLESYRGMVRYSHSSDKLELGTLSQVRATIDSSGNVTVASGDVTATSGQFNSGASNASGPAFAVSTGNGIYNSGANQIGFSTNSTKRWTIDSSGNLVANGTAIDFGSAATSAGQGTGTTGSVSNSVLSDYEYGSWTPTFKTTGTNFAALTMDVLAASYVKVGRYVHCQAYIRTDNVDVTGATGNVEISGLPFVSDTTANSYSTINVGYSGSWVNAPAAGYVHPNSADVRLTRYSTTGASMIGVSDMTAGASANVNEVTFTVSYIAST